MPLHNLFGGHHHGSGGGGGGGHHHHLATGLSGSRHHFIDRHMQYLPLLFYGLPFLPRRPNPNSQIPPPPPPTDTVFTLSSTEGELKPQYYVPSEASDLLDLNELNTFLQRLNQVLHQTSPSPIIIRLLTLVFTLAGIYLFFVMDDPYEGFETFITVLLGFSFGFVASQFIVTFYAQSYIHHRKKRMRDFLESENHQLFLSRGCHWEEHIPLHNYQHFYLYLIKHTQSTASPRFAPSAPPMRADAHPNTIPIAVAAIAEDHPRYDIEMASAPLLHSK